MIYIITFTTRNGFISSSVVPQLWPFCVSYLFVFVTKISIGSFIPVTIWNISKGVEPWSRLMSSSASKVHFFFVIGFSLSSHFHSLVALIFFFFVLSLFWGTLPFFCFALFLSNGAVTFFFFILIIELCFGLLVFLGRVTLRDRVQLGDWSEVRLVTTTAGDWLTVHWVAPAGDWLEVRWVAGTEFGSSWPKVLVSLSFWIEKMWIDASGTETELLWSPISSFQMILLIHDSMRLLIHLSYKFSYH